MAGLGRTGAACGGPAQAPLTAPSAPQGTTMSACAMRPTSHCACRPCSSTRRPRTTSLMTTRVSWGRGAGPRGPGGQPRGQVPTLLRPELVGGGTLCDLAFCLPRLRRGPDQPHQARQPDGPAGQTAGRPHWGERGEPAGGQGSGSPWPWDQCTRLLWVWAGGLAVADLWARPCWRGPCWNPGLHACRAGALPLSRTPGPAVGP